MPLDLNTFPELVQIGQAELRREKPTIDATIPGSWSRAFTTSFAGQVFSGQNGVNDVVKQAFLATATDEFLDLHGVTERLPRNTAVAASGLITLTGIAGTIVPAETTFRSSVPLLYDTLEVATITAQTRAVLSLTRAGTVVTAVTPSPHNLSNIVEVTISGAMNTQYNGVFSITVLDAVTFIYSIISSPPSPASGTIEFSGTYASVEIRAQESNENTNLVQASVVTVIDTDVVVDLDDEAIVQASGIVGGSAVESDDAYRRRLLLSRGLQEGVFTATQVQLAALGFSGNTRAFVKTPTNAGAGIAIDPAPGQTSVFILRDDDPNPVPPQGILDGTKVLVVQNGRLPAQSVEASVFVVAPTPLFTLFTFTSISPDTLTMQTAIRTQLTAFFRDEVQFEQTVFANSYIAAIQSTQDLQTGDVLQSFVISAPAGNIIVSAGEIAFYDDVGTTFV